MVFYLYLRTGKNIKMETTIKKQTFNLDVPLDDVRKLRSIAKAMGWTLHRNKKSQVDKAIEEMKNGKVYEAKDAHDMLNQILG